MWTWMSTESPMVTTSAHTSIDRRDKNMWTIELQIIDGTTQTFKAHDKYEAKMKYDHFIQKGEVEDVYVFDEDGEYIDPIEL